MHFQIEGQKHSHRHYRPCDCRVRMHRSVYQASGGGLYNDVGNLIGVVNAKIVYDGVENIGYAIPSNVAISIAENIIDYCYGTEVERVQRALLGITVSASNSKAVYDSETGLSKIIEKVLIYEKC